MIGPVPPTIPPSDFRPLPPAGAAQAAPGRLAGRGLRLRWAGLVALGFVLVVVALALASPYLPLADPNSQTLSERLQPPAWQRGGSPEHLLGTDHLGRDVLSRLVWGTRISVLVGLSVMAISGLLGVSVGLVSGYAGGLIDNLFMRLADIQLAFPFVVLCVAVVAVLGPGLRNTILVLGIAGWVQYARVARSEVLAQKSREYVLAARTLGASPLRIIVRHILPNIASSAIVIATLQVANAIVVEASLSFLGLGVSPRIPSWGGMLNEGQQYLGVAGWISTFPGLAIAAVVLAVNLFGDALKDALDPRLRLD